jgi:hypothetical protein
MAILTRKTAIYLRKIITTLIFKIIDNFCRKSAKKVGEKSRRKSRRKNWSFYWVCLFQDGDRQNRSDGVRRLRVRQPAPHVGRGGRLGRRREHSGNQKINNSTFRNFGGISLFFFYFCIYYFSIFRSQMCVQNEMENFTIFDGALSKLGCMKYFLYEWTTFAWKNYF